MKTLAEHAAAVRELANRLNFGLAGDLDNPEYRVLMDAADALDAASTEPLTDQGQG